MSDTVRRINELITDLELELVREQLFAEYSAKVDAGSMIDMLKELRALVESDRDVGLDRYDRGYEEGYEEGYDEGFQEGKLYEQGKDPHDYD